MSSTGHDSQRPDGRDCRPYQFQRRHHEEKVNRARRRKRLEIQRLNDRNAVVDEQNLVPRQFGEPLTGTVLAVLRGYQAMRVVLANRPDDRQRHSAPGHAGSALNDT